MIERKKITYFFLFFVLVGGFFVLSEKVSAQTEAQIQQLQNFQLYSADDIFVDIIPEVPGPNQEVTLRANSYSFNLNNYYISWFKDGVRQNAGFGQREYKFTTGEIGKVTTVVAAVEFEGQVFRKEMRFAPSEVNLLWEVIDGYAPPFYKGKVLPLPQSEIRMTAIPQTFLIKPSDARNLIYYWDQNYERKVVSSGFGKQSFQFTAGVLSQMEKISVTANDRREASFAKETIDIPVNSFAPKILFYEIDENGRILTNKALNTNSQITGDTLKLAFHPLFMSTPKKNFTDLFVDWSINDIHQAPQNFNKQNELYISSGGESGAVQIGINLEGISKLLQKGSQKIELHFQ